MKKPDWLISGGETLRREKIHELAGKSASGSHITLELTADEWRVFDRSLDVAKRTRVRASGPYYDGRGRVRQFSGFRSLP